MESEEKIINDKAKAIICGNSNLREFELKDGSKVGYRVIGPDGCGKAITEVTELLRLLADVRHELTTLHNLTATDIEGALPENECFNIDTSEIRAKIDMALEPKNVGNLIEGHIASRGVTIDGKYLSPEKSQGVHNHSPDGFNWGYFGSGPAQLALAIMLEFTEKHLAIAIYQDFKNEHVAAWPQEQNFQVEIDIQGWIKTKIKTRDI